MEPGELFDKARETLSPEMRHVWLAFAYGKMEPKMDENDLRQLEDEIYSLERRWFQTHPL